MQALWDSKTGIFRTTGPPGGKKFVWFLYIMDAYPLLGMTAGEGGLLSTLFGDVDGLVTRPVPSWDSYIWDTACCFCKYFITVTQDTPPILREL